jgi:5-formyltetrahydrofolate cyclo-ligase
MAPTYFRREPGIDAPTAIAAPRSSSVWILLRLNSLENAKAELRRQALASRDALPATARAAAAQAVAARPFPFAVSTGSYVSGYMPLKSEINPIPLMRKLADAAVKLALPVVSGRGRPLVMRSFTFGDQLISGVWGIREPSPDAQEVFPEVLVVPLLAFDRRGNRLGYGAGYYDLTIAALRARQPVLAVGIAFAQQEQTEVPAGARDARLDLVLTEREVIDCRAP